MSLSSLHKLIVPDRNLVVVSGCSSSGKSTLLEALASKGKSVVAEPGRRVVKEQLELGLDGLPWVNPQRFVELCVEKGIADFDRHAFSEQPVFFDRSLIDSASAIEAFDLVMPGALSEALKSKRYSLLVFMSAPWEALFETDAERRHSFEASVAEYEKLVPAYQNYGYEVVFLPQSSIKERVSFVLSQLSTHI